MYRGALMLGSTAEDLTAADSAFLISAVARSTQAKFACFRCRSHGRAWVRMLNRSTTGSMQKCAGQGGTGNLEAAACRTGSHEAWQYQCAGKVSAPQLISACTNCIHGTSISGDISGCAACHLPACSSSSV